MIGQSINEIGEKKSRVLPSDRIFKSIPANFDAYRYLEELMMQMPGWAGRCEIAAQLAQTLGRKNPFSISYLNNVLKRRQKLTDNMKLALWLHSQPFSEIVGNGKEDSEWGRQAREKKPEKIDM